MLPLKTARLLIRNHHPEDAPAMNRLLSDPVAMRYLPDLRTGDMAGTEENLRQALVEIDRPDRTRWFFVIEWRGNADDRDRRPETDRQPETDSRLAATRPDPPVGTYIGEIGYTLVEHTPEGDVAHFGWFILPQWQGRGIVTEAAREVFRFAFEEGGVIKAETGCLVENGASEAVMRKLGMVREAYLVKHTAHEGVLKDRVEYRLMREEWEAARREASENGDAVSVDHPAVPAAVSEKGSVEVSAKSSVEVSAKGSVEASAKVSEEMPAAIPEKACANAGPCIASTIVDPAGMPAGTPAVSLRLPKAILFDYGQTLLDEQGFDPVRGTAAVLAQAVHNPRSVTAEQVQARADALLVDIGRRGVSAEDQTPLEVHNHIFNRYLYESFGMTFTQPPETVERIFWDAAAPARPAPGIRRLLAWLASHGIRTGVESNISYSGHALAERLRMNLPEHAFDTVIASSEYVFRKPHPRIFRLALDKSGVMPHETWFCGDHPYFDIEGAAAAGMTPVWYTACLHHGHVAYPGAGSREPGIPCLRIGHWDEMVALLEGLAGKGMN